MPPFRHLRSDYPLNLTLLERPYAYALTQSYRAGLPSARAIPVSLIGSNWWFLSRFLVDRAFDAQHYSGTNGRHFHSVEPRIYTGSRTNFCSSACAPSTSKSTCGLTHAREFRLNIDEQLAHLVEHWCASPRGNSELDSRELAASLLSPNSALYAVAAVHMLSTSGRHFVDNHSSSSGVSDAELDGRSAIRVCHFLACLVVDRRASHINLGGAHDVSKQRSSKF
jgi:hypothetical protein